MLTGIIHSMEVPCTQRELDEYHKGERLIQDIMPHVSPQLREFIISGITPQEWDSTFAMDDDINDQSGLSQN